MQEGALGPPRTRGVFRFFAPQLHVRACTARYVCEDLQAKHSPNLQAQINTTLNKFLPNGA